MHPSFFMDPLAALPDEEQDRIFLQELARLKAEGDVGRITKRLTFTLNRINIGLYNRRRMMKRFSILGLFLFLVLSVSFGCFDSGSSSSKSKITKLNIISGNSTFVESKEKLAQIGEGTTGGRSAYRASAPTTEITNVTADSGSSVTVETAVKVNDNYVFLGKLTTSDGNSTTTNSIVNLTTGAVVELKSWPSSLSKVTANDTRAFYISGGKLLAVELATGTETVISESVKRWDYTSSGYLSTSTTWSGNEWVYVDAGMNIYAVDYERSDNDYGEGMGAKFVYSGGTWTADDTLNSTWFPNMPYNMSNEIPGSLLVNNQWLIVDQNAGKLYEIVFSGTTVSLYNYNIETWTRGTLAISKILSAEMYGTVFLGFNNAIQNSVISDGDILLRLASSNGAVTINEIVVPSSIPTTNTINWGSGYVQAWEGGGAVTNWSYSDGVVYFINPSDSKVYSWDITTTTPSTTAISDVSSLNFYY